MDITAIFKQYQSQLKGYIGKRVSSREDRDDIMQDVFYKLLQTDPAETPIRQISAWLYSVARNLIIDRNRKHKEEQMPLLPQQDGDSLILREVSEFLFDADTSPEKEYTRSLVWEELDKALAELPEEQRAVFELTELQGFSFKEISDSTGITVNTLISRKHYAVLYLREKLCELYEELLQE